MTALIRLVSSSAILILFLAACGPQPQSPSSEADSPTNTLVQDAFDQFSQEFIEAMLVHSPEWAIYQGRYENADQMTLPTPAQRAANLDFLTEWMAQLEAFNPDDLRIEQRPDYALMHNVLSSRIWYQQEFRSWQWNPASYNVVRTIAVLLNTEFAPLDERLRIVMARLASVPEYYEAARQNIDRPTLEHIDLAMVQNQGAFSVLNEELVERVRASGLSATEKAQFEQYFSEAEAAIRDWIDYLGTLSEQWANRDDVRSFRIGAELYEQKFSHDIQSQFSAEELYQRALAEKERLLAEMDEITINLWPDYFPGVDLPGDRLERIGTLIDHLSDRHVALEEFVPEIRRQIPQLAEFVRENDLLFQDPNKPLVVRETPEYMRGTGAIASVSSPGPFNPGAETYYNITPLEYFGPEAAASYLREYNHWILQILNIHEAIPGHYTQLLHANLSPSLVKSLFGNGAMIEGWAVYSERMMLEEGWGDYEPELWLMHGKWLLRVVHNAILDYEVQVLGRGRDEIVAMLQDEAFQEVSEATQKWRRATLSQVQLTSYYAGYAEIYELRERMKAEQGEDFNLRDWHNEFLSHGSAPVSVIAELMQEQ
ncbi:MAG TPA: DUF885 domain-containing protein [Wenzhouxiangella sp.]